MFLGTHLGIEAISKMGLLISSLMFKESSLNFFYCKVEAIHTLPLSRDSARHNFA